MKWRSWKPLPHRGRSRWTLHLRLLRSLPSRPSCFTLFNFTSNWVAIRPFPYSRMALGSSGAWGKRLCYFISLYASFPMFGSSCSQFLGWGLAPEKTDLLALLSAGKKAFRGISRLEKVSFNYLPLSNLNTGWELLVSLHKSSTKRISYSYGWKRGRSLISGLFIWSSWLPLLFHFPV